MSGSPLVASVYIARKVRNQYIVSSVKLGNQNGGPSVDGFSRFCPMACVKSTGITYLEHLLLTRDFCSSKTDNKGEVPRIGRRLTYLQCPCCYRIWRRSQEDTKGLDSVECCVCRRTLINLTRVLPLNYLASPQVQFMSLPLTPLRINYLSLPVAPCTNSPCKTSSQHDAYQALSPEVFSPTPTPPPLHK